MKVGEYNNASFSVLDLEKVKTKTITFTATEYHERHFWLNILEPLFLRAKTKKQKAECEKIREVVKTKCWPEIRTLAKNYKKELLAHKGFCPAVRQAIELLVEDNNETKK